MSMARIPVALQLYSVRRELDKDVYGTLKAVAEMGYDGVEFAGAPKHSPEVLRAILDEVGLVCCGWHIPYELVQPNRLEETIAFHKTLGNRRLVIPGVGANTRQDWENFAAFLNDLSEKLAPFDMKTGYHNHTKEFTEVDGEQPWDTVFGNTNRRVIMQLDVGNAYAGGADCLDILKRYPGRAETVHVKSYSIEQGKEDRRLGYRPLLGDDGLPWEELFSLCETVGETDWYIVEYESDLYPPMEAVERFLKNIRALGR
jgi:sugar phosphate isomerase/epimerase